MGLGEEGDDAVRTVIPVVHTLGRRGSLFLPFGEQAADILPIGGIALGLLGQGLEGLGWEFACHLRHAGAGESRVYFNVSIGLLAVRSWGATPLRPTFPSFFLAGTGA